MPLGGSLIPMQGSYYRELVEKGRVSLPVGLTRHDKEGDLVDVVNDDNPREEVEATLEKIEPSETRGISICTFALPK